MYILQYQSNLDGEWANLKRSDTLSGIIEKLEENMIFDRTVGVKYKYRILNRNRAIKLPISMES